MFTKNIFSVFLRNPTSPSTILTRNYAFKTDLKIKWIRPEKISCIKPEKSGDPNPYVAPEPSRYLLKFDRAQELKDADENVKNFFRLGHNRRNASTEIVKEELIDKVKRHELDYGSVEAKLAKWTAQIRSMQEVMEKFPRNKKLKVILKEKIDKRKRFLRYLRKWDYKKFEWVVEQLDIIYKPYPAEFHWITRKESLQKLVSIHCNKLKQEKLNAYRKKLESQQLEFLENKIKNLEFIRDEQVKCKVPVTVAAEEIEKVKQCYQELKVKRDEDSEAEKKLSAKDDYDFHL